MKINVVKCSAVNMNLSAGKSSLYFRSLLILSLFALLMFSAFSQEGKRPVTAEGKRPVTSNEGKVTEAPRRITMIKKVAAPVARPEYGWVIVQTDVDNAEVKINGQRLEKSQENDFRKELPANREYTVLIAASADFEPYKETFMLSSKQPKIIEEPLKSKFAALKIVTAQQAIEGAKVLIDGKEQSVKYDKATNALMIERLTPGNHVVRFDHPDYVLAERQVKLTANTEYTWSFLPERPLVELAIQSDPETMVYVDNEPRGEITSDGKINFNDIKIGAHDVRLVKDGYEEYKQSHNFEFRKPVTIEHRLVPKVSKDFNDLFDISDTSRWTMPGSGFKVESGWLTVTNAPQLGYPTNFFYRNFTMQFQLKLNSDEGAAWAVRAKDAKNYYLFYLSGPKGLFPNKFLTYIVRDNQFDPKKPIDVPVTVVVSAKKGDSYTVRIEATENIINHVIIPSALNQEDKKRGLAGEDVNLSSFTDQKRTFAYGGVGFRTIGAETFSVDEVYVKAK